LVLTIISNFYSVWAEKAMRSQKRREILLAGRKTLIKKERNMDRTH
jgi:hypothetical protein